MHRHHNCGTGHPQVPQVITSIRQRWVRIEPLPRIKRTNLPASRSTFRGGLAAATRQLRARGSPRELTPSDSEMLETVESSYTRCGTHGIHGAAAPRVPYGMCVRNANVETANCKLE